MGCFRVFFIFIFVFLYFVISALFFDGLSLFIWKAWLIVGRIEDRLWDWFWLDFWLKVRFWAYIFWIYFLLDLNIRRLIFLSLRFNYLYIFLCLFALALRRQSLFSTLLFLESTCVIVNAFFKVFRKD